MLISYNLRLWKSKIIVMSYIFYQEAFKYTLSHFPLQDDVICHEKLIDFSMRRETEFDDVRYFVERVTPLKGKLSRKEDDL